jgi:hypothetical protein
MNTLPYKTEITFNNKHFIVLIKINETNIDDGEYHYDIELRTKSKISGDEFQKLRRYLEAEGYIDQAIQHYSKYF